MQLPLNSAATTNVVSVHSEAAPVKRLLWVEYIKALALIWIIVNHLTEQLFGSPYFGNPSVGWPSLSDQLAQLKPLTIPNVLNVPLNLLRYVGWYGDQGVQLFLILSGFGLTWGLLSKLRAGETVHDAARIALRAFYQKRFTRIYPFWWAVHLFFVFTFLITGWGIPWTGSSLYLSLLGFRLTPHLLYFFAPAWWYVGLLIQLYLIYPFLWVILRRLGPLRLLVIGCVVEFVARAIGLRFFGSYIDAWQRGAIFITQIAPFVFGISLAAWFQRDYDRVDRQLRSPSMVLIAFLLLGAGIALSFSLLGMAIAPFIAGVGVLILLYAAFGRARSRRYAVLEWIGKNSLSLFLVSHPFILLFVPSELSENNIGRALIGTIAAIILTVVVALFLQRVVDYAVNQFNRWRLRAGFVGLGLRVAAILIVVATCLFGVELAVRQFAPQEINGWGERPSLQADLNVGWHLKPATVTRLRWEGYDYTVTANKLGFPGPDYPVEKGPQVFRILTSGDAFTSAEGVDTAQAWPRLLASDLSQQRPDRTWQVMNFAITGYGPNQYAAVAQTYMPIYKPDLILQEIFVNDYQDVAVSDGDFRQSIGFGEPDANNLASFIGLANVRRFVDINVNGPMLDLIQGIPDPNGYFLGNFAALERNQPDFGQRSQMLTDRLKIVKEQADKINAKVVIVMIPAPVQVCTPQQLAYYPQGVNLNDSNQFDLDLPQRTTKQIADSLGMGFYDLRSVLQSSQCYYFSDNMHWLPSGHVVVANFLLQKLVADHYIPAGQANG